MLNSDFPCTLNIEEFARLFGTTPCEVEDCCGKQLASMDLRYRIISGKERDDIIISILKRIDAANLPVSGEGRQPDWEKGWVENLADFIGSGYDVEKLVPKYFKKMCRLGF